MCNHGNDTVVLVHIPANLSQTGKDRFDYKPVDSCLASIIQALNESLNKNIHTTGCCCGHGKIDGNILFHDGRELIIKDLMN